MSKFSPCGEKLQVEHGYIFDEKSKTRIFTEVNKINLKEKIQTAGIGSSLYEMIAKYQKTGDDSFLRAKANALSIDITNFPKNLIELYNLKTTCAEDFKQFPVDYRALFNHNIDEYIKAIQDNSINDITKKYFEDKDKLDDKLKEVKDNE